MSGFAENFRPKEIVYSIRSIDVSRLCASGFDTALLDMDNTLLPWIGNQVPDFAIEWVKQAQAAGMKICIVSNTHKPSRLKRVAESLGVSYVARALKPRSHGFDLAMCRLDSTPEKTVVIGDQLLTDIWGGNRAGMYTILVRPMHPREFVGTKVSRLVEAFILRSLGARWPDPDEPAKNGQAG
jgi:uncharacterized protein